MRLAIRPRTLVAVSLFVLSRASAASETEADALPAARKAPAPFALDGPLRRALAGGCHDGIAELEALAASGQPGSDVAAEVVRLCADIRGQRAAGSGASDGSAAAHADRSGRPQLVLASTLYGVWLGISVDVLADVKNDRLLVMYPLLGMAAGLGGSLYATHVHEVTSGQAWSIITGLDYGTYNGLLWSAALSNTPSAKGVFGAALPAGLLGGAIGTLVARRHPQQGDVELVRSGGLYGTAAAAMAALLFAPTGSSSRAIFTTLALGMDVGLGTGGILASELDVSRNRVLLVDAGTVAGLGFGLGGTWLITGSKRSSRRALGAGGLVGLGAGMVAAILLTRAMDDDRAAQVLGSVPALASRHADGTWTFGALSLTPVGDMTGRRQGFVGAAVPLAAGLW